MAKLQFAFLILLLTLAETAHGVPSQINYQGRLTNNSGQPITAPVTAFFTFWDAKTGGHLLGGGYTDFETVTPNAQGVYSTLIGSAPDNPIPDSVFAGESVWLNININGEDINPRKQITTVGYAFKSKLALSADNATTAAQAIHAKIADQATLALSAIRATAADSATNATNAAHATAADTATTASNALHATAADIAATASNAAHATAADTATTASNALHAIAADTATTATNAHLLEGKHAAAFATTSSLALYTPRHTGAIYRWAAFSTYDQAFGWIANDDPNFFGGVRPSIWGDGMGVAASMSSDKEVLRTLFTQKGYGGKNAVVYNETWTYYSSTNSRHALALFRIRNTTPNPIMWQVNTFQTAYGSWGEVASVALNGASIWNSGGNAYGAQSQFTHALSIPGNRVSTAIFISASSAASGTQTCFLAFSNNCLQLPAGLEYVDDLDTATGGWTQ